MKTDKAALLNLIVIALNEAIRLGKIDLNGTSGESSKQKNAYFTMVIGGKQTVVNWLDIGCDELRLSVWWDYDHSRHPQQTSEKFQCSRPIAKHEKLVKFVGACASCWLERQTGKYIMGKNGDALFETYVRRTSAIELNSLPSEPPMGYEISGRYIF
ncbi:hypothetical protein [Yersinia rohdei]|uniref:hypothetical protein n=1 Tax=Yersinia rohdei TaxID=29485 RepID=UPI0021BD5691|nr:hypothetical protein [Yersinia rohdei]